MNKLKQGDKAPLFSLLNQDQKKMSLADFHGKKLLLYFYPKADTPGCTKQACSVSESLSEFKQLAMAAVGISPDAPDKQKKFDVKYKLGFPLLSDPDGNTAKVYGAWGEKSMYGKKYEGILRSCILVDEKGFVMEAWYNIKPEETVPKAKAALS